MTTKLAQNLLQFPMDDNSPSDIVDLLTIDEVAALLKVPKSWIYERTRRRGLDRLPYIKLGKYLAVRRERDSRVPEQKPQKRVTRRRAQRTMGSNQPKSEEPTRGKESARCLGSGLRREIRQSEDGGRESENSSFRIHGESSDSLQGSREADGRERHDSL